MTVSPLLHYVFSLVKAKRQDALSSKENIVGPFLNKLKCASVNLFLY